MPEEKRGPGQPTKYRPEHPQQLLDYFTEKYEAGEFPTLAAFAITLNVAKDTILEWSKVHEEFSVAYKRASDFQEAALVNGTLDGKFQQAFAIFTAKNVLHWRDQIDVAANIRTHEENLKELE